MIITEFFIERADGVKLYRTFSDSGLMIQKIGTDELYTEAVDEKEIGYKYTETDIPVPEDAEITVGYMMELLGELGVDTND